MLLLLYQKRKKTKLPCEAQLWKRAPRRPVLPAQGPKTRERSLRPQRSRPGRVEPDSRLKFQGTGRTGVSALGSNGVCVWDVLLDRWPGADE